MSFVRRVPDSGRAYRFRLTNLGGAPLNRPEVELVDSDGQTISSDGPVLETDNLATDESEEFVLKVSDDHQDVDPLRVRVSWWTVDFDQKEQISNVEVPPG